MGCLETNYLSAAASTNRVVNCWIWCSLSELFLHLCANEISKLQRSLTKAAFLSARNDAIANITIIIAGIITIFHASIWPDILVGLFIAYIRTESALEIYKKASNELKNIQESSKKN